MAQFRDWIQPKATTIIRGYQRNPLRRGVLRGRQGIMARTVSPYFWYGRYPHTFLERRPPLESQESHLPRVIWSFWVGDNPLTPGRQAGLKSIRTLNSDLEVELITADRLKDFILPTHPLHPAYELLSYNHRSDYLRAYFLHHYGGGYADIKPLVGPWAPAFNRLDVGEKWVLGPALTDPAWAGNPTGKLEVHLRRYYKLIPSGGMLIARSHTNITGEWVREIERRLDYHQSALREQPGEVWGQNPAYPIEWMGLQGNIFQPIALKYLDRIALDASVMWDTGAKYR